MVNEVSNDITKIYHKIDANPDLDSWKKIQIVTITGLGHITCGDGLPEAIHERYEEFIKTCRNPWIPIENNLTMMSEEGSITYYQNLIQNCYVKYGNADVLLFSFGEKKCYIPLQELKDIFWKHIMETHSIGYIYE